MSETAEKVAVPPPSAGLDAEVDSDPPTPRPISDDAAVASAPPAQEQPLLSKRFKSAQVSGTAETPRPPRQSSVVGNNHPTTPLMLTENPLFEMEPLKTGEDDDENDANNSILANAPQTPVPMVDRRTSYAGSSSPSDLSASSKGTRDRSMSPMTPYVPEVPPAPPSTPASVVRATREISERALQGLSTPIPYAAMRGADILLQQQLLSEGAVTPAPKKRPVPQTATALDDDDEAVPPSKVPRPSKASQYTDDFSEWAVGDRYKLVRMLGRGSYGEVAQAIDLQQQNHQQGNNPHAYVAIKRIPSPFDQEVDAVRLFREMHILRRVRGHECVIQLLDVVQPPSDDLNDFHDLYLVFEYVDTDLYKLIMSPQYLTTEHIQTFLYQMLAGVKYLHSASVIHRDLKPANILLNEDCSLKLCDFGLARIVHASSMGSSSQGKEPPETNSDGAGKEVMPPVPDFTKFKKLPLKRQLTKHVVTRWYRAPELILLQPYTSAVDIWSLGCILAELLSMQEGSVPSYQDRNPLFPGGTCYPLSGENTEADERMDQLSVIFGVIGTPSKEEIAAIGTPDEYIKTLEVKKPKNLKDLYPSADAAALDLLKQMLQFNPNERCTAQEAMEHDFLKGVRTEEMERNAPEVLVPPEFLEADEVDLGTLKRQAYDEVLWYRDHEKHTEPPIVPSNGKLID